MEDVCNKDPFIGTRLNQYINQLRQTQAKSYIESVTPVEIQKQIMDDSLYGRSKDMNDLILIRESATNTLHELSPEQIERNRQEALQRIKLSPLQTVDLVSNAISVTLEHCNPSNVDKKVHNTLSTVFYSLITLGEGMSVSLFPKVFDSLFENLSRKQDDSSKPVVLKEMNDHESSVSQKLKQCNDIEKKHRIQVYLEELESTIQSISKTTTPSEKEDNDNGTV
jgi:hypothetical protein